ncbi:MAG: rhamnulokinase [Candidatus Humimicrobiaceae bacterium]
METKNYLLFDMGSSHGRALIAAYNGKNFELRKIYDFENIPVSAGNTLYWDILKLFLEIKNGLKLAFSKYPKIESFAINSWGVDFGFIDKNGKLISNPIHYRDTGRFGVEDSLYKIISKKDLYKRLGSLPSPVASIFNLFYLKSINSLELNKNNQFLMIPSIFNYFLTGIKVNEYTHSTTTFLYDIEKKVWDNELIEMLKINKSLFGEVAYAGTILGDIKTDIALELSVPKIKTVLTVTHDTASAVAGVPAVNNNSKWAFASIGTWCTIGIETQKPVIKEEALEYEFYNEGSADGKNLLVRNIIGLWIIQECRLSWINEKNKNITWKDIDSSIKGCKPFKSLINVDDEVFIRPNSKMPEIIERFCSNTNQIVPEGIGEISRCFYESLALKIRYIFEIMEKIFSIKIDILHIVGGGSNAEFLCQSIADATEKDVLAGPTEATAAGNLIMQLVASGEINNAQEGRNLNYDSGIVKQYRCKEKEAWDSAYEKFLKILDLNKN